MASIRSVNRFAAYYHVWVPPWRGSARKVAWRPAQAPVGDDGLDPTKVRILVVDDDPDFVCAHQLALERAGFHVDTASSGSEALERLVRGGIDLLVLDVMLNHPTEGFEVCSAMRQHPAMRLIPVLMVSSVDWEAYAEMDPENEPNSLMCDDFARKPVAPAELVQRVRGLLEKRNKA